MDKSEEQRLRRRLAKLDADIDGATGWGAWLAETVEERDAIAGRLGLPARRIVGAAPLVD